MNALQPERSEMKQPRVHPTWLPHLRDEFETERMRTLRDFLVEQKKRGQKIYPRSEEWFGALNTTPFDDVKVVILGQDPYHGPGQAHGLCFSVRPGVPFPPSLDNIFKELHADLGIARPTHGCLTRWAEQGVLLLNSVLTVEDGRAASHQGKGWEQFTDRIIQALNEKKNGLVFVLWGAYAQKKGAFIDRGRHLVLESPHPSPLSAHRGFFGTKPFSKINAYLRSRGVREIDWSLEP